MFFSGSVPFGEAPWPLVMRGVLNVTIRLTVSPETVVPDLLKRYGDALNYSIKKIVKDEALSLSKAHKSLYNELKKLFNLPPDIVKQLEKP